MIVLFPDGPRDVPDRILARNKLGDMPPTMRIPRPVPGFEIKRGKKGWEAHGREAQTV